MKKLTLKTLLIALIMLAAAPFANAQYHDDFTGANDTVALQARGYLTYFRSAGGPGTAPYWFQGNAGFVTAFNGADTDYVMSNFNCVTGANNIDNWLVLPALNVNVGDGISFYSQSVTASTFADSIRVMYSSAGATTPEDLTWVELGRFKVNTQGIWQLKTYFVNAAGPTARFAIRYAVADGGPQGANSDNIGIDELNVFTPATLDGGVSAINVASGCGLSAASPIEVVISNFGLTPISNFPVSYTINGGSAVTETYTGTINSGATAIYTFAATANFSAVGSYAIAALTGIPSDGNTLNDMDTLTIASNAPNALGAALLMSFEPTDDFNGWVIGDDQDADGITWAVVSSAQFNNVPHTGDQAIRLGVANTADDWAYSPCLDLSSNNNYNLEFWYKKFADTGTSPDFAAFIGTAQNAASMTQNLVSALNPADSAYTQYTGNFTVPVSGVYHIGFQASAAAAFTSSVRIDDINITNLGPVGIKEINKNVVSIFPNPSTGVFKITTISNATDVRIYNTLGEEVYSQVKLAAGAHTVDLSNLAKGIYTVKASSDNKVDVKKITINN